MAITTSQKNNDFDVKAATKSHQTALDLVAARRTDLKTAKETNADLSQRLDDGDETVSVDALLTASFEVQRADKLLGAALAAAEKSQIGLDIAVATESPDLALLLGPLISSHPYELRLHGWTTDIRPRPGKSKPTSLPEVCISQQTPTTHDDVMGSCKGRVLVTFYAATEDELPMDFSHSFGAVAREANLDVSIGNTSPIEVLDGCVRKVYEVDIARAVLPVPVLLRDPAPWLLNGLSNDLCSAIRRSGTTFDASGRVITSRKVKVWGESSRVSSPVEVDGYLMRTVTTTVSADANYATQVEGRLNSDVLVGQMQSGLGRVVAARLVKVTPYRDGVWQFTSEYDVIFREV